MKTFEEIAEELKPLPWVSGTVALDPKSYAIACMRAYRQAAADELTISASPRARGSRERAQAFRDAAELLSTLGDSKEK